MELSQRAARTHKAWNKGVCSGFTDDGLVLALILYHLILYYWFSLFLVLIAIAWLALL
jgi:hypothetical protein